MGSMLVHTAVSGEAHMFKQTHSRPGSVTQLGQPKMKVEQPALIHTAVAFGEAIDIFREHVLRSG